MTRAARLVAVLLACCACAGIARAAVFGGIEYGRDGDQELLLDVRTPSKPGPFPVWVEWVERGASPLIVPDREMHAAGTVLVRAVMPSRAEARTAAAAHLLSWLPRSISGYGGDPERVAVIVRGSGAQSILDLWKPGSKGTVPQRARGVRALVLVEPPASLRAHGGWPDLSLLLMDKPERSASLWETVLRLRNQGIAVEPVIQSDPASAPFGLSTQVAGMLAASDVRRVQRFDQLAFDPPIRLAGRVLDAIRYGSSLVALMSGEDEGVRLVSIDAEGRALGLRRWSWRADARLFAIGGRILVVASDELGRPHVELGPATNGPWTVLSAASVQAPVRLVAATQRGRGEVALAWSGAVATHAPRAWLQRVALTGASARLDTTRPLAQSVQAVAYAGQDVFVAFGPGPSRAGGALARWRPATRMPVAVDVPDTGTWEGLFATTPDEGTSVPASTLLGMRAGRLFAVDLSCTPACLREELDYSTLLDAPLSRSAMDATPVERIARPAPASQWLRHPETGEWLLALLPAPGSGPHSPAGSGAWLIRQSNGRYGFARLPAGKRPTRADTALRAVLSWPTATEPNRFALISSHGVDTLLHPARMQRTRIVPGLWWDPARSGHGFDLRRAGDGWQVTIYTFDEHGEPTWFRGEGDIREGRWRPDDDGLLRYRVPRGSGDVEIDPRSAQALEIAFGGDARQAPCAGARAEEWERARATLVQGEERSAFCLEPLRLAAGGRPRIDVDGVWNASDEPAPWQLSLTNQGDDPRARISAMLTYFDRSGAPRWAYAASDWRAGQVDLPLLAISGACAKCSGQPFRSAAIGNLALRATGECGAIAASATIGIGGRGGAIGLPAGRVALTHATLLGCY